MDYFSEFVKEANKLRVAGKGTAELGKQLKGLSSKWYTPRGVAQRVGLGFEATGRTIRNPVQSTREGWKSLGGWTGTGKNPFTGKDSRYWKWTKHAPVGMKSMTVGFAASEVPSLAKKDPYNPDAGTGERVLQSAGRNLGFIAGWPAGLIGGMTASELMGAGGKVVGKGLDATGRLLRGRKASSGNNPYLAQQRAQQ